MTDPRAARGIPQRLSDPQATASVHWTDPRAALAEALEAAGMYEKDDPTEYPGSPIHAEDAADIQKHLAERGVLLVTEAQIEAALFKVRFDPLRDSSTEWAERIFAALSGEATE